MDFGKIDLIMSKYGYGQQALISILHDIQAEEGYLPEPVLEYVSGKMGVALSRIYSIATFYQSFRLEPPAVHRIQVCWGTACYLKGAPRLMEALERSLHAKGGHGNADRPFTLETINCPGTCAQSPVMLIDGEEFGETTPDKVESILADCQKR